MPIESPGKLKGKDYLLLGGLLLSFQLVFIWLVNFNGLFGQDAHAYLKFAKLLFSEGFDATASEFYYPVIYPLSGALLAVVFSPAFAMQLISMLALLFSAYFVHKLIVSVFNSPSSKAAIYVVIAFVLSPYVLRTSFIAMSEMLAIALVLWALFNLWKYWQTARLINITFFALAAGLAFFTRYSTGVLLLLPFLAGIFLSIKRKKWHHLVLLFLLPILAFIPQLLIKGVDGHGLSNHVLLVDWSVNNMFAAEFSIREGQFQYQLINLLYIFYPALHPGFLLFGIFLLFFLRKQDFVQPPQLLGLVFFVCYGLFLAGIPFQNMRFLVLGFPMIVVFFYPAFQRAMAFATGRTRLAAKWWLAGIVVIQLGLFMRAFYPLWQASQVEQSIADFLEQLPPTQLYTFSMDVPLESYDTHMNITNLRYQTIAQADSGNLVLFNEKRFQRQWEGLAVMNNWEGLRGRFQMDTIHSFDDGWVLYELRQRK